MVAEVDLVAELNAEDDDSFAWPTASRCQRTFRGPSRRHVAGRQTATAKPSHASSRWTHTVPPGSPEDLFVFSLNPKRGEWLLAFSRPPHVAATGNAPRPASDLRLPQWRIHASASPTKVAFNSCDASA
jgi:hypothetical protein